jgi:hypothetical protein
VKLPVLGRYQPATPLEMARVVEAWLVAITEIERLLGGDCTHQEPAAAAGSTEVVAASPTTATAAAASVRMPFTDYWP